MTTNLKICLLAQACFAYLALASISFAESLVASKGSVRFQLSDRWKACTHLGAQAPYVCFPAKVPGHVILDVCGCSDPYIDFAEIDLSSVLDNQRNWTYSWRGTLPQDLQHADAAQIVFESVDTLAVDVLCNQRTIGTGMRNAFRKHVFDMPRACLNESSFQLSLTIESSLHKARHLAEGVYKDKPYPHTINYNVWSEPSHRNLLRKPASDFGWDWGPSFPLAGLPGKVYINSGASGLALIDEDDLAIQQDFVEGGAVVVTIDAYFRRLEGTGRNQAFCLQLEEQPIQCSTLKPADMRLRWLFKVENPRLWYPRTSPRFDGRAELYKLFLYDENTNLVLNRTIGLRKVEARTNRGRFHFLVNEELVDWRGFNVIPFDAFKARTDWNKINRRIREWATHMNINALRMWGGGYFADDTFYETCDRLGIMIWQDLPWACAVFPATDEFLDEAKKETKEIVLKLGAHPSIIVWGGNNEVEASFEWFPTTRGIHRSKYRADYNALFLRAIQEGVREAAGLAAVYLDSSPSNGLYEDGSKRWGDVTDPNMGDVHFYNYYMNCEDRSAYPKALFVSEHGVQSMPSLLKHFITDPSLLMTALEDRQRHEFGFEQSDMQARRMFAGALHSPMSSLPFQPRAILSQIVQGRCLSNAVAAWRAHPRNHGVLLWQLNDVWPGMSWSVLEYDLSWKVSAHMTANAFSPIRLVLVRTSSNATSIRIQAYGELAGKRISVTLRAQSFALSNNRSLVEHHVFTFVHRASETELAQLPGNDGWYVSGFAIVSNSENKVHSLEEWSLPNNGFQGLISRETCESVCTPKVGLSESSCEISITACDGQVEPYTVLILDDTRKLEGRFSRNAFFSFPGEVQRITFLPLDAPNCNGLAHELHVWTLREIFCGSNSRDSPSQFYAPRVW